MCIMKNIFSHKNNKILSFFSKIDVTRGHYVGEIIIQTQETNTPYSPSLYKIKKSPPVYRRAVTRDKDRKRRGRGSLESRGHIRIRILWYCIALQFTILVSIFLSEWKSFKAPVRVITK